VTIVDWLLERSLVYRTWQLPFAERKLEPILRSGDIARAKRVLDVGCGPGTNAPHFAHADYLGVDINPSYVATAARRYGRKFVVADVTRYSTNEDGRFDFVLLNSLLHHIKTEDARHLLSHIATLLTDDGHVHILDLVLPAKRHSISGILARADRGDYARPIEEWQGVFALAFDTVRFESYQLGLGGATLWNMVYFKGRARQS